MKISRFASDQFVEKAIDLDLADAALRVLSNKAGRVFFSSVVSQRDLTPRLYLKTPNRCSMAFSRSAVASTASCTTFSTLRTMKVGLRLMSSSPLSSRASNNPSPLPLVAVVEVFEQQVMQGCPNSAPSGRSYELLFAACASSRGRGLKKKAITYYHAGSKDGTTMTAAGLLAVADMCSQLVSCHQHFKYLMMYHSLILMQFTFTQGHAAEAASAVEAFQAKFTPNADPEHVTSHVCPPPPSSLPMYHITSFNPALTLTHTPNSCRGRWSSRWQAPRHLRC